MLVHLHQSRKSLPALTIHHSLFTIHYSLVPIPYSLFPIPYSLFPIPSKLRLHHMPNQIFHRGMHDLEDGLGPDAEEDDHHGQHAEDQKLPGGEVAESGHRVVGHLAVDDPLVHPQVVGGPQQQDAGGQEGVPEIGVEAGQDDHELAHEAGGARQARVGHDEQHHECGEYRHGIGHTAVGTDLAGVHAVVEHPYAQEQGTRYEAMGDHLHHAPLHAHGGPLDIAGVFEDGEGHEEAQGDEAHVRDAGIGHQLLEVLLDDGHEADVDHGDEGQADHEPVQLAAGIGGDGQAEAQEAVAAHLQHDGRQHHGAAGGGLHVGIRQPGVHRPHGYLNREGDEEGQEDEDLRRQADGDHVHVVDGEAPGLAVEIEQGHQHEHRAQEGIEKELDGGIDAVGSAPDADNEEHGDEHGLPEHIEQHGVHGGEHAVHQALHDEEGRHVLAHLVLNHLPGGYHHQHRGEGGQQYQGHGETIHPQVIVDAEGLDPGHLLHELHGRRGGVEAGVERDGEQEGGQGHHQGNHPRALGVALAGGKDPRAAQDGQPHQQAQKGQFLEQHV